MIVTTTLLLSLLGGEPADTSGVEFFEKKIRPVLAKHCYECHSQQTADPKGGLRVDTRESIRRGGDSGPAVVPHDLEASLLLDAIRYESLEMPPKQQLDPQTVLDFEQWIERGAPDPRDQPASLIPAGDNWQEILAERRQWWSLQPVRDPPLPRVANQRWARNSIDRFVLARLEDAGLKPAPRADTRTLMRRLSFFLTGMPPALDDVRNAPEELSDGDYLKYVDELLSSPQFGERWARHWMDVVGFGETHGHEWNFELRDVWRYRDYLIRAFNDDVPFDRMIREHVAGDLLSDPRWNNGVNESLIGTAFLRFGEVDHDDCRLFPALNLDVIDHQIDRLTKAFQATTVSCARCHDHKLDAISMKDYYALSGILASSRNVVHTIDSPDRNRETKRRLVELKVQVRNELAALWGDEVQAASKYMRAALHQLDSPQDPDDSAEASGLNLETLAKWKSVLEQRRALAADGKLELQDVTFPLWAVHPELQSAKVSDAWTKLRIRYECESAERVAFNERQFVELADFRSNLDDRWDASGLAVTDGIAQSGDLALASDGDVFVRAILPAGFHSHRVSRRFNACLKSPVMPQGKRFISFEVLGGRGGVWRHVFNNCAIQNAVSKKLDSEELQWQRVSMTKGEIRMVVEFATKFDDQGFPYLNHNKTLDGEEADSFFGVARVVAHDCDESPKSDLRHVMSLFNRDPPRSLDELAELYGDVLCGVVSAWSTEQSTDDQVRWLNWLLRNDLISDSCQATERIQSLANQYRQLESQLERPRLVSGVADFDSGFDVRLRLGGDPLRPGPAVSRRYVQILSAESGRQDGQGSGRFQLAQDIVDPRNPLTARVIVNRIWHHVFGNGLVRTTDDFGRLGEVPSHPALLDHLASRFVRDGWSIKKLIRLLVSSQAFQMSGATSDVAMRLDPANRMLHHYPLRRLEAEAIRDSILSASGRLDRQLYGRSIHPHRFVERPMRRLFSGPVDGGGRRSIYTKVTLTEEPPFLSVFNLPDPKHVKGRRDVTTVPAQALALLNDPFVVEQSQVWAKQLLSNVSPSIDVRLVQMFETAFARPPSETELCRFREALMTFARLRKVDPDGILNSEAVWKDLAHTMFNTKEFIFIP